MMTSELNDLQLKLYYFEYLLMTQLAFPGSLRTTSGGRGLPPDDDRIAWDFSFETLHVAQMFIHFTRRVMGAPRFENADGPRVNSMTHYGVPHLYYCRVRCLMDSRTIASWFRRMQPAIGVGGYADNHSHVYLENCKGQLRREGHKDTSALAIHHKNGTTPIGGHGI